jgi:WhiB family redox-sensing transcriptional regulator
MRRNLTHDDPIDMTALVAVIDPRIADDDWRERAACRGTFGDLFFPDKGCSVREAKMICRGCSVKAECLSLAEHHDLAFGVFGGLSAKERRARKHAADLSDAA